MSTHLLSRRPPLGAAALLLMLLPACSAESLEALDAALGGDGSVDGPCSGADAPSAGCPKDPPPPGAVCGDGAIEAREQCDDGNTHDGDGCNSACALEPGTDPGAVCGDGVIEAREQCDDGNTHDGDGCSSDCTSSTVAFAFSGAVVKLGNGTETGEDPLNTGVQVGDPIRGVYRFNPHNVADHRSYFNSAESQYAFHNTPGSFEMEAQIGPLSVTSIHVPPMQVDSEDPWYSYGSAFTLWNGVTGAPYDSVDSYRLDVRHNAVVGIEVGRPLVLVELSIELAGLLDPSAMTSTALPTTPPELGRFDEHRAIWLILMTDLGVKSYVFGELTSLTLAPGD
ncbi:uncharacterized protein SOCEGT47_059900 [Sorangium cellulosum]|uniref:DUF4215 domain-containing protein n=1 Tax=Sorangium cellulosum TaxID=56 RepID=A0A4P2Q8Q7_SORCE|nr:myxococcus cysteine-rich repeat containing protein [Sorangium cellulosum]AUX25443.1 uncharacterized protein SOCEGT47_059900 [Sorangium cellulosum]